VERAITLIFLYFAHLKHDRQTGKLRVLIHAQLYTYSASSWSCRKPETMGPDTDRKQKFCNFWSSG